MTNRDVNDLAPVPPSERIHALDLLRGLAMFGVLWSNLNDWYGDVEPVTALDRGLAWTQYNLIEGRFYTLLALLFGVGFGIQLLRATERGVNQSTVYFRRFLGLLVIGAVHAFLISDNDILMMYALVAFALVLFRNLSQRHILIAAILCWFIGPEIATRARILGGWGYFGSPVTDPTILANGSWLQIEPIRVATKLAWMGNFGLTMFFFILALFLVGLWLTKSGYLLRVVEDPKTTRRLLFVALIMSVIGFVWFPFLAKIVPQSFWRWPLSFGPSDFRFWIPTKWLGQVLGWSVEGMAVAYAAILILLSQRSKNARFLWPLAATGRMALTTYVVQSGVCTLLFFGYGLGWYGSVGYTGKLGIVLVLFSCQMAASVWWLNRFRFGPLEWLWRTMTYGRGPRMRSVKGPEL